LYTILQCTQFISNKLTKEEAVKQLSLQSHKKIFCKFPVTIHVKKFQQFLLRFTKNLLNIYRGHKNFLVTIFWYQFVFGVYIFDRLFTSYKCASAKILPILITWTDRLQCKNNKKTTNETCRKFSSRGAKSDSQIVQKFGNNFQKFFHLKWIMAHNLWGETHISERANIVETAWAFDVFLKNYFECVINDVIF
jgi:hypothetical protein